MGRDTRDYSMPDEIHMEPGELHEPTNTVPSYSANLESALSQVSRHNVGSQQGSCWSVAMNRINRTGIVPSHVRANPTSGSGVSTDPGRGHRPQRRSWQPQPRSKPAGAGWLRRRRLANPVDQEPPVTADRGSDHRQLADLVDGDALHHSRR